MRLPLLLATFFAATLAGCLDEGSDDVTDGGGELEDGASPALPENIDVTEMVVAGADPWNLPDPVNGGSRPPCSLPSPASTCATYEFVVAEGSTPDADVGLTWDVEANDFDLYLRDAEGEEVASDADSPPETEERLSVSNLPPGSYTIQVVMWAVAADSYHLTATFSD